MSTFDRAGSLFGWRARIGWISSITVIEATPYDFYRMAPEGVGLVLASLCKRDQSEEETEAALARLPDVAAQMGQVGVDYIIVNSSPMVIHRGPGSDRHIIVQVEEAARCPATTTTTAAMDALRAIGARRLVLVSPYEHQNAKLRAFLEADGFTVLTSRGLRRELWEIGRIPSEATYRLAKEAFMEAPTADAVYIAGGLLRAVDVVEPLEQDLGVPVIASQPASLWSALVRLRIRAPISGFGSLLANLPPAEDRATAHEAG